MKASKWSFLFSMGVLSLLACSAAAGAEIVAEEWVARYNGNCDGDDEAVDVEVDAAGYVYVTGTSVCAGSGQDYATIKYDADGDILWVARYNGPSSGNDRAADLAVDEEGNVYVTGEENTGDFPVYATIKYDPQGNVLWVARHGSSGGGASYATALVFDASGNVYVTGASDSNSTWQWMCTIKYDQDGNQLWTAKAYGTASVYSVIPVDLAVDSSGNVVVTSTYTEEEGIIMDYYTVKYDSNGKELWTARYDGVDSDHDRAEALGLDAMGNVYVTGTSVGWGLPKIVTVKYDSDGNQLWRGIFSGRFNYAIAKDAAVDAAGNVYVTGYDERGTNGFEYVTVKIDPSGGRVWEAIYAPGRTAEPSALVLDAEGNVYVTGFSADTDSAGTMVSHYATVKYDKDSDVTGYLGYELWTTVHDEPGRPVALAVDAAGNVYVTGASEDGDLERKFITVKYSQTETAEGDLDLDGDVDRDDVNLCLSYRNTLLDDSFGDPMDLDEDGQITVLDARIIVTLCTRPGCATE